MLRAGVILVTVALALPGCAAPLIPLLAIGAEGALKGTQATLSGGVAYRTFTLPADQVVSGARATLQRMDLKVVDDEVDGDSHKISAEAANRAVRVTVERITPVVSRLGVVVYRKKIMKDVATGAEIIAQMERTLKVSQTASR
jgi:hypothetical protein